jgi:hypothetical protein
MSASDERAVAQLAADLLKTWTPVATFNDGTRDYAYSVVDAAYVLVGASLIDPSFWYIATYVAGSGNRVAAFYEVVDGSNPGQWTFTRIAGAWQLTDSNASASTSTPPVMPNGFEFFESSPAISGIEQIALAGDDDDLTLPAIVVRATFEEEARALKKNGHYGGRYRVDIELRGLRTKPGTATLDAMLREIETAMDSTPDPLPDSAFAFSYFLIDERLNIESRTNEETRELTRSYSVFALLT